MVSEQQAERSAGQLGVGQKLHNQLLQEDIDELHEIDLVPINLCCIFILLSERAGFSSLCLVQFGLI